jgi:hypothetical protein
MGLFSSAPEVDQELAQLIIGDEEARHSLQGALAKSQEGLPSLLEDSEEVRAITRGEGDNQILVITDRRLLRVKKGKLNWAAISLSDIAEAKLGSRDLGGGRVKYMLAVATRTSTQYSDADNRRYMPDHFFTLDFDDPQEARAVHAVIDLVRPGLR